MKNITTFIGLFITLAVGHTANTWAQMRNISIARSGNVGFSIGTKGYMGLGTTNSGVTNDFWEYNPIADTWTQKANFGGSARELAVGFAIGSKGYVGTGGYANNDFWEYNPSGNSWTQKANFSGSARNQAAGFAIGSKAPLQELSGGSSLIVLFTGQASAQPGCSGRSNCGLHQFDPRPAQVAGN